MPGYLSMKIVKSCYKTDIKPIFPTLGKVAAQTWMVAHENILVVGAPSPRLIASLLGFYTILKQLVLFAVVMLGCITLIYGNPRPRNFPIANPMGYPTPLPYPFPQPTWPPGYGGR